MGAGEAAIWEGRLLLVALLEECRLLCCIDSMCDRRSPRDWMVLSVSSIAAWNGRNTASSCGTRPIHQAARRRKKNVNKLKSERRSRLCGATLVRWLTLRLLARWPQGLVQRGMMQELSFLCLRYHHRLRRQGQAGGASTKSQNVGGQPRPLISVARQSPSTASAVPVVQRLLTRILYRS